MAVLLRILLMSFLWFLARFVMRTALRGRTRPGPGPSGPWGQTPWDQDRSRASTASRQARSPYEVLQVRHGASREEITAAYRRLVRQYHPDKVANLAPEFREVAERRMKEINAAYEQLKRRTSH
ncbi:DnaJ family molecular chaperone [Chloroflexota bacterium]